MKLTRMLVGAGLLFIPALLLVTGCQSEKARRSSADANIQNAKLLIKSCRETFAAGRVTGAADPEARGSGVDTRLPILLTIVADKIPFNVNRRVTDPDKKAKALAKLAEVTKLVDESLGPKYQAATNSQKPEDAKALVPLLDQLDQQLDELHEILG
jgi:hypothetical protein